jgi:hypothetical protein
MPLLVSIDSPALASLAFVALALIDASLASPLELLEAPASGSAAQPKRDAHTTHASKPRFIAAKHTTNPALGATRPRPRVGLVSLRVGSTRARRPARTLLNRPENGGVRPAMTIRGFLMASMMSLLVLGGCSVSFMGTPASSTPGYGGYGYNWDAGKSIYPTDDAGTSSDVGKPLHPSAGNRDPQTDPSTAQPDQPVAPPHRTKPVEPPQRTKPTEPPHRTKPTQPGDVPTRPGTDTPKPTPGTGLHPSSDTPTKPHKPARPDPRAPQPTPGTGLHPTVHKPARPQQPTPGTGLHPRDPGATKPVKPVKPQTATFHLPRPTVHRTASHS